MTQSINTYPSTSDFKPMKGGQDIQLALLEGARKRYKDHGTTGQYITSSGEVCAVGAVIAEAGVCADEWDGKGMAEFGYDVAFAVSNFNVEKSLVKATKKVMKRLDRAAATLYPESVELAEKENWTGPLEAVNESMFGLSAVQLCFGGPEYDALIDERDKKRRRAVLRCYTMAIVNRKAKLAAKAAA